MMFTPARIIVVDNEADHVVAITDAFRAMGMPCLGLHYDGSAFPKQLFGGVRILLMDLHLLAGTATTKDTQHYAVIASMLEDYIDKDGGPFIVVLWTQNPQQAGALIEYLEQAKLPPHARPLTILPMAKNDVLNLTTGKVSNAALLQERLMKTIADNAQINALLSWEAEVYQAAGRTLSSLLNLVPAEQRTVSAYSTELDKILSRLVFESGGKNAGDDIRGSINNVLTPVLSDRLHAIDSNESEKIWQNAVTQHKKPPVMTDEVAGQVNQMLHAEEGPVAADTWGAVLPYPQAWRADQAETERLGLTLAQICQNEFALKPANVGACQPVLIRIGAVCDYAQKKTRLIPYVVGFEKPVDVVPMEGFVPAAVWQGPVLTIGGRTFHLIASARYVLSLPPAAVKNMEAQYRLREQLLVELIDHVANYTARPGIVAVHVPRPEAQK